MRINYQLSTVIKHPIHNFFIGSKNYSSTDHQNGF